jgi:arsenate reductase
LCTGNSARSILAECLLNRLGEGRYLASSAGSHPKGHVHPQALALLKERGFEIEGLSSKGWEAFAGPAAAPLDLVITVCDAAAGESCPIWPGAPLRAHWSIPDPAAAPIGEAPAAFLRAYRLLEARISRLAAIDPDALEAGDFIVRLREIASEAADNAA